MDDELLPIGRFARAAGLTIGALRHYDEEGVLVPADVDPSTGYRRYRRDQLQVARAVAALRDLELSLPAIRALLGADEPGTRASILREERVRLEARTARLQRALHRLHMLSLTADERAAGTPSDPSPTTDEDIAVPTPPPPPDPRPHGPPRARGRAVQPHLGPARAREPHGPRRRRAHRHGPRQLVALAPGRQRRERGPGARDAAPGSYSILGARIRGGLPRGPGQRGARARRRGLRGLGRARSGRGRWPARSSRRATSRAPPSGRRRPQRLLEAVADAGRPGVVEGDLAALPV